MNQKLIIILIVLSLIILGAGVYSMVTSDDKNNEPTYTTNEKELKPQTKDNSNISKYVLKINYEIPDEIKKQVPMEKIDKVLVQLLDERRLLSENNIAKSDGILSIDYINKTKSFTVSLNNYDKSKVYITVYADNEVKVEYI